MQTLGTIFVIIITAYLNAVNGLADFISAVLLETTNESYETASINTQNLSNANTATPNQVSGGSIPQILLDNAAYQKAAIVESILPEKATSTAYDALVNIYCEHENERTVQITTGTGFFIDTTGIILTNAHVAHFLLMDNIIGDTTCVIRTGNPAEAKYIAELLYISPAWVRENAAVFRSAAPVGTGERDYALLYVTRSVDKTPLPRAFPALPFEVELLRTSIVGQTAYVAGYPAQSLFEDGAGAPLIPRLSTTTVAELMTFGSNYADVFTISGTPVGERGASGGPVLTTSGDTIGLISTKGDAAEFGEGALRAITLSYIDRTIKEETGFDLRQNLGGNIPFRAAIFNETMVPFLRLVLEQEL